jgi:dihydroorotase
MQFAIEEEFRGWIHFTHISLPESVDYIDSIKNNLIETEHCSIRGVSCDTTPHHLFGYDEMMNLPGGIVLKVNPPLRSQESQKGLLQKLRQGKIDFIATDHAPHALDEKLNSPYLSGIPGLDKWPKIVARLKQEGFSEQQIADLTFNDAVRIFGLNGIVKKTNNQGDINLKEYAYGDGFYL